MNTNRRTFLKVLGGASATVAASASMFRAFADPVNGSDEFFIFIHASGGWDVTLWADPRNERKGLVDPAATDNTNITPLRYWVSQALGDGTDSFALVQPPGSRVVYGPAIGGLYDLYDRICLVNGIAMNTVSHPDGTVFSATGRHLAGGRVPGSSIDALVGSEFGIGQLFPVVSMRFPSSFIGGNLDRRATPLMVDTVGSVGRVLSRSSLYDTEIDRNSVTALLSQEALDLAKTAQNPDVWTGMALHLDSLQKMVAGGLKDVFDANKLKLAQPAFKYNGRFQGANAINAAFAIEAMKRNLVRCASFQLGGLDTHNGNYIDHATNLQELFDVVATLVKQLDATPHPTKTSSRLSEHTHILIVSEFCRTPQINFSRGRDHYPNNSSLIISPRFQKNFVYGKTDSEQLLPLDSGTFADGTRPIAPPDVLATFLGAMGVDPRKYLRDGDVVKEMLAP